MAEPLEQLLQHISRKRPHRRAEYQPAALLGDPGMRSQAMADAAQGVDISDAAPSTRLRAQRFDPDVYAQDEAPEPDDDGGDQPASPFQFASMTGEQPQASPVQYRKECGPNGCQEVPVFADQPSAPVMRQLPPGVTVGPGETLDWNSIRDVPSTPQASAMAPAAAQYAGPSAKATPGPLYEVSQYYAPAASAFQSMVGAGSPMDKVAYRNLGEFHMNIGNKALELQMARELKDATMEAMKQNNAVAQDRMSLAREELKIKSGQKRLEIEDEIRNGPGSPMYRAQKVVAYRLEGMKHIQLKSDDLEKQYDMEFGIITANDVSQLFQAAQSNGEDLKATPASDPLHGRLKARGERIFGEMRQRIYDRFGSQKDPNAARIAMEGELYPVIYKSRYDHHAKRGANADDAKYLAASDVSDFMDMARSGLAEMQSGQPAFSFLAPQAFGVPQQTKAPPPKPAALKPAPASAASSPAQTEDAAKAKSWLDAWTGRAE